jgi:hypothetical protein
VSSQGAGLVRSRAARARSNRSGPGRATQRVFLVSGPIGTVTLLEVDRQRADIGRVGCRDREDELPDLTRGDRDRGVRSRKAKTGRGRTDGQYGAGSGVIRIVDIERLLNRASAMKGEAREGVPIRAAHVVARRNVEGCYLYGGRSRVEQQDDDEYYEDDDDRDD